MGSDRLVRVAAAVVAALGLLLAWSSHDPFDLDTWRQEQIAGAFEVAQSDAPVRGGQEDPANTPTPTPVPASPTGTRPATAVATESGVMALDCDARARGVQTACSYGPDEHYTLQVHILSPPEGGYFGFEALIAWSGPIAYLPAENSADEALWPDCDLPLRSSESDERSINFACAPFPALDTGSTFSGAVLEFDLVCAGDGTAAFELTPIRGDSAFGSHLVDAEGGQIVPALRGASVGCGTGDPPTPTPTASLTSTPAAPQPTPTEPPGDRPARPGTSVEVEIDADGGRVDSADGRVSIEFPANATDERLAVRITHRDAKELPSIPDHPVLSVWEFEAFAVDRDRERVDQFAEPVRISTSYVPEDLFGRRLDTLRLWTWNEAEASWEALESVRVPHSGTVTAEVDHFSIFGGTANPNMIQAPFLDSFQTDLHTGASQVTVPIEVPPGRGGLQPQLALMYSSNGPNEMKAFMSQGSWVGVGWNLGVGGIRKVYVAGDETDTRYFLDLPGLGDELLPDPVNPHLWRTKRHQYLRIQEVGDCDQLIYGDPPGWPLTSPEAPCHWIVTDKSGTKYFFGGILTPDANSTRYYDLLWENGPGPLDDQFVLFYYQWDLLAIVDTHGNEVEYEYEQEILNDFLIQPWVFASYPKKITYNGGRVEIDFVLGETWSRQIVTKRILDEGIGGIDPIVTRYAYGV